MVVHCDRSMDPQGLLVLIVGAGVAGLQTARALMKRGFQVVIIEQCEDVGGVWIRNYQGYGLQVPWEHYQFPEFPYPRSSELADYPSGEAVRQYVQAYARHFDLYRHTLLSSRLVSLRRRQCVNANGARGGGGGRGGGGCSESAGRGSSCGSDIGGGAAAAAERPGRPATDADGCGVDAAQATRTLGAAQECSAPGPQQHQHQHQQPLVAGNERRNGVEKQHHHHQNPQSDPGPQAAVATRQEAAGKRSGKGSTRRGGWVVSCLSGLWGQGRRYRASETATEYMEPVAAPQGQLREQVSASAAGAGGCVGNGHGSSSVGGCLLLGEGQRRGSTTGELQLAFGATPPDYMTTPTCGDAYDSPTAAKGKVNAAGSLAAASQPPQPPPRTLLLTTGGAGGGGGVVLGGGDGFTSHSSTSFSQDVMVTGGPGVVKLENSSPPPLQPPQGLQPPMAMQRETAKGASYDQSTVHTTPPAAQAAAAVTTGYERPPPQQQGPTAAARLPWRRRGVSGKEPTVTATAAAKGCSAQQGPEGPEAERQQAGLPGRPEPGLQPPYSHHLPGGWQAVYEDMSTGRQYTLEVNFVVLCTGLYATPFIPAIAGQELYRGLQVHSRDFTDAAVAAGKRVLVVGGGKTALDIVAELTSTKTAAEVTLLYRRPIWPLPRHVGPVSLKSLAYTRLMSAVLLPPYYTAPASSRVAAALLAPVRKAFWVRFMARVNASLGIKRALGTPTQSIYQDIWYSGQVLDAARWPVVMHSSQVQKLQGEVARFTPVSAVLQNGTELQPDIVLYATGYSNHYTFLEPALHSALHLQPDGLYLYRHCLAPDVPGLAFVGAEVSTFNNILTVALQAEWLAAVLAGDVALPPPAAMAADVAAQQAWRRRIMPPHKLRGSAVMLYMLRYHDQLLRDLGATTRRKHGSWRHPLAEYLEPYKAADYAEVFKRTAPANTANTVTAASTARARQRSPQQMRYQQKHQQRHHTAAVEGQKSSAGAKSGHEHREVDVKDAVRMGSSGGGSGGAAAGGVPQQPGLGSAMVTSAAAAATAVSAEETQCIGSCRQRGSIREGKGFGRSSQRESASAVQTPMQGASVSGSRGGEASGTMVSPPARSLKPATGAAMGPVAAATTAPASPHAAATTAAVPTVTSPAACQLSGERSGGLWEVTGSMCPSGPPYRQPPHVLPSGLGGFSSTGPERCVLGSFPGRPGVAMPWCGDGTQCDQRLGSTIDAAPAGPAAAAEAVTKVSPGESRLSLVDTGMRSTAAVPARAAAGAGAGPTGVELAGVGTAAAAGEPSGLNWRGSVGEPLYDVTAPSAAALAAAMATKELFSGAEQSEAFLDEQDTLYSLDALPPALQAFRRTRVRAKAEPPSDEGSWNVVSSSVCGRGSTASAMAAMTMTQLLAAAATSRGSPAVSGAAQRCGVRAVGAPHAFGSGSGEVACGNGGAVKPSPFLTSATRYMLSTVGHASGPLPPRIGSTAATAQDTAQSTASISPTSLPPPLRPFSNPFVWASGGGGGGIKSRAHSGAAPSKDGGTVGAGTLGAVGKTQSTVLQPNQTAGNGLMPNVAASLAPAVLQRLTAANVSGAEVAVDCSSGSSSVGGDSTDGDSRQQHPHRRRQRRGLRRGFSLATLLMRNRTNNAMNDIASSRMEPSSAAVSDLAYRVLPPRHVEEALAAAAAATLKPRATGDGMFSRTTLPPQPRISAATTTAVATATGRCAAFGMGTHSRTVPSVAAPALRTVTSPVRPNNISRFSVECSRAPSATVVGSSFVDDVFLAPPPPPQRLKPVAPPASVPDGHGMSPSIIPSSGVSYLPSSNTSPSTQHSNAATADGRTPYQIATSYQQPLYNPSVAGVGLATANGVANGVVGGPVGGSPAHWGLPTLGVAPLPSPQQQQQRLRPHSGRLARPPYQSTSGSAACLVDSDSSSSGESYLPTCSTVIAQPVMQAAQHWL